MNKIDHNVLKYSSLIIIIGSVFYNFTLEHLIRNGYSSPSVLLYRGILTFIITVILSAKSGNRLIPENINRQLIRIFVSGTALLMAFESYNYLESSTVFVIARLDIPFAILIGLGLGARKVDFKVRLALLALLLVGTFFFNAEHEGEKRIGLVLAITGILMVSISYMLIKKATGQENNFVILNSTNIGCILVGLLSGLAFGNLNVFRWEDFWIFLLASVSQFVLNYTLCNLLRHKEVEHGQRPFLIAALFILVVEQVWHGRLFDLYHSATLVVIVGVIFMITLKKSPLDLLRRNSEAPM